MTGESNLKDLPGQLLISGRGFPKPPRPPRPSVRRAWRVAVADTSAIVAATTRGKAVHAFCRQFDPCDFDAPFVAIRATRAPRHDAWAELDVTGQCCDEDDLPAGAG